MAAAPGNPRSRPEDVLIRAVYRPPDEWAILPVTCGQTIAIPGRLVTQIGRSRMAATLPQL